MPSPLPPIKDSNQPIANGKHIVGWPCVFPRFEDSKQPTFSSDAAGIRAVARCTPHLRHSVPHRTSPPYLPPYLLHCIGVAFLRVLAMFRGRQSGSYRCHALFASSPPPPPPPPPSPHSLRDKVMLTIQVLRASSWLRWSRLLQSPFLG